MAGSPTELSSQSAPRCARCHALLTPTDRFCAVCGSTRRLTGTTAPRRRGLGLLVGSTIALLAVFAAVAWIYFSAPERHLAHPVSQVDALPPLTLAISPGTAPALYLGSARGVQVSDRTATNWRTVNLSSKAELVAASPNASTIYLANPSFQRGDGRTWQTVPTDLPTAAIQALAVDPFNSNQVYAVVAGRGLYRSADGGAQWSLLGRAIPTDADGLTIGPGHDFYLATSSHGVFASSDGVVWSHASGFVNDALPTPNIRAIAYDARSGDTYVGGNGQQMVGALYVATDRGLFKSIDGGGGWSSLPLPNSLVALAVDPAGSHLIVVVAANGGVYLSKDGGVSWQ